MSNEKIFYKGDYLSYDYLNLDINISYIINKIKIVNINDFSMILNYTKNFSSTKFNFDVNQEKYSYDVININKLTIGIKDTEIEDIFPKNESTKYVCLIQYPNYIYINNIPLEKINCLFCLLFVKKLKIETHDEQEIALYLFTLQYWNYLLGSYKYYGWIDNLLAIVNVNNECYVYSIKIKKDNIKNFIDKCKIFKYDFEDIVIEKCKINVNNQSELIKYLGFGVFEIFKLSIFDI